MVLGDLGSQLKSALDKLNASSVIDDDIIETKQNCFI